MDNVRKAIILRIKSRYNYSSSKEAVSHYLQRVYPHPDSMDAEDKLFYTEIHSSLENLIEGQGDIKE